MTGTGRGWEQLLHINVQRFRGGLVFKADRLFVSLNYRLESNEEEGGRPDERDPGDGLGELHADRPFVLRLRPPLPARENR